MENFGYDLGHDMVQGCNPASFQNLWKLLLIYGTISVDVELLKMSRVIFKLFGFISVNESMEFAVIESTESRDVVQDFNDPRMIDRKTQG